MKKLMKKFEDLMVAVTFAEAGEYDVCREIMCEEPAAEAQVPESGPAVKAV